MHTYVGGITNAPGSIGFAHALFAPPAQLIRQALGAPSMRQTRAAQEPGAPLKWASATRETGRGTFALFWSLNLNTTYAVTCAGGIEGTNSSVSCPHSGIEKVKFADFGTPNGDCAHGFSRGNCTTENLTAVVTSVCTGQERCTIECRDDRVPSPRGPPFTGCVITTPHMVKLFPMPDPCNHVKKMTVLQVKCNGPGADLRIRSSAPANSIATTAVPLLGASAATVIVSEGGTVLWRDGAFVSGVDGVMGAVVSGDAILVSHGSGTYDFRRQ